MWFGYSLLAALFETAKDSFGKVSVLKSDEYTSAFALHFSTLVFSLPLFYIYGIPSLKPSFWLGSLAFFFITPAWTLLYMKALKLSPLSVTLPMMAFNPVFTALLSYLFGGNTPDFIGWTGIFLISAGIYFVHAKNLHLKYFKNNLLLIFSDKGALAMLGVAFLWSLGAHFSEMRVDGSSAYFATFTGGLIGIVTTLLLAILVNKQINLVTIFKNYKNLLPMSLFYYLATYASSVALTGGSATYVFSVKRSSILFSSLAGKFFFHETINKWKYIGLALIAGGIIALA